jgi:hypothetical protein
MNAVHLYRIDPARNMLGTASARAAAVLRHVSPSCQKWLRLRFGRARCFVYSCRGNGHAICSYCWFRIDAGGAGGG